MKRIPWRLIVVSCCIFGLSLVGSVFFLQACAQRACKVFDTKLKAADAGEDAKATIPFTAVDNRPCQGFACDKKTQLCKSSCATDNDCNDGTPLPQGSAPAVKPKIAHYVCYKKPGKATGSCRCNTFNKARANDKYKDIKDDELRSLVNKLECHLACETNSDCNDRSDPNRNNEVLSESKGYVCKKVEGKSTRQCVCGNETLCGQPKSGEGGGEDGGSGEDSGSGDDSGGE